MDQWLTGRPALRLLIRYGEAGPNDGVLVRTGTEAVSAAEQGFSPENIFFPAPFSADAALPRNGCRFVAGCPEDLLLLDRLAEGAGTGCMFSAGLRLQAPGLPCAGNAFSPESLAGLSREIRRLRHVTVRGCFFCGDLAGVHGGALGRFFRGGYEAAKRMTAALPCAMPYLCFENAASAVRENAVVHPETLYICLRELDVVAMQNETAFYAKLYLG